MRWAIWKAVRRWAKVPEGEMLPKWLQAVHALLFPIHHLILNKTAWGIGYVPERDVIIIYGIEYDEALLRHLAYGDGRSFRIIRRENGVVTIADANMEINNKE